jgi:hypothetical protein
MDKEKKMKNSSLTIIAQKLRTEVNTYILIKLKQQLFKVHDFMINKIPTYG